MGALTSHPILKQLPEVRERVRAARWAKKDELLPHYMGAYREQCHARTHSDCIIINRLVFGPIGDKKEFVGSDVTIRQLVLPHEGNHKLLKSLGLNTGDNQMSHPFLAEKEEDIVMQALAYYVTNPPLPDPLPAELGEALTACTVPLHCVSQRASSATDKGNGFMGTPVISLSQATPSSDFNNDGIQDFIWESFLHGRRHTPHLQGLGEQLSFPVTEYYNDCQFPFAVSDKQLWELSKTHYGSGRWDFRHDFLRFFNPKQSMSFAPDEKVLLRSGGAHQSLESLVIIYDVNQDFDPKMERVAPQAFALISGCKMVGLDELIWVTKNGERLDMDWAKIWAGMAPVPAGVTPPAATSAEIEMASLLKAASLRLAAEHRDSGKKLSCAEVLPEKTTTPLLQQLPEGWEKSFCFTLGISPYPPRPASPGGALEAPRGAALDQ